MLISKQRWCWAFLLLGLSVNPALSQTSTKPALQIAFLPDIHFHDIYAEFADGAFQGITNKDSEQKATIRNLSAELNSTRLFNENYFALLAALDDIAARGVKLVALPGDFSDDGQPIHVRGLAKILDHYAQQYDMQFFATNGNHDPVRPFDYPGGKSDFLGQQGQPQAIYSLQSTQCISASQNAQLTAVATPLAVICSDEVQHLGYQGLMSLLKDTGFFPQPNYLYWETPYSDYQGKSYDFLTASTQAEFKQRQYEICQQGTGGRFKQPHFSNCSMVADSSYLVEPVEGLWLLAIDANVYLPDVELVKQDSVNKSRGKREFYGSGNAGYNLMFSHKTQVIEWIESVVKRAEQQGKKLLSFSHFPMSEFYDGQSAKIATLFGAKQFQLARRPQDDISQRLADIGLKLHVGGHMHMNDTSITRNANGQFLINIQAPSIAAYVPAYKLLTLNDSPQVEVETIELDEIPRFNELFAHYQEEYRYLQKSGSNKLWDKGILSAKNYREFTNWHIRELTRQRFLPQEWPQDMRELLFALNGEEMLVLSVLKSPVSYAQFAAGESTLSQLKNSPAWQVAVVRAHELLKSSHFKLQDFALWNGFDLAVDFYRLRNAGHLALKDIGSKRLAQYHFFTDIMHSIAPIPTELSGQQLKALPLSVLTSLRFAALFDIMHGFKNGAPNSHFSVDLSSGDVKAYGTK